MLLERRSFPRRYLRPSPILFIIAVIAFVKIVTVQNNENGDDSVFDGFNNVTGVDQFIVPNIIHFIRFNQEEFSYIDYICMKAAFLNHKPDYFYIHTNAPDGQFKGKYWGRLQNNEHLKQRIRVLPLEVPTKIFGKTVSEGWRFYHASEICRIRILMKYGGIFLDNDIYVIHSLDKYRRFEAAVNWDEGQFLGNQVIIANRSARILPRWLNTFQDYRSDLWYYNGGELPTKEILYHHPHLIHRVKKKFGVDVSTSVRIYKDKNFEWRKLDTIHLLVHHRSYLDPRFNITPYFDENIVKNYTYPFGDMAREVEDYSLENINDKKPEDK